MTYRCARFLIQSMSWSFDLFRFCSLHFQCRETTFISLISHCVSRSQVQFRLPFSLVQFSYLAFISGLVHLPISRALAQLTLPFFWLSVRCVFLFPSSHCLSLELWPGSPCLFFWLNLRCVFLCPSSCCLSLWPSSPCLYLWLCFSPNSEPLFKPKHKRLPPKKLSLSSDYS